MNAKTVLLVMGLSLALGIYVVFSSMFGGTSAATYAALDGPEIYKRLCQQCHGERGTAPNGAGDTYARKREFWDEESLLRYIANPSAVKKTMPHMTGRRSMQPISRNVPIEARKRLVAHVLELMDDLKDGPRKR